MHNKMKNKNVRIHPTALSLSCIRGRHALLQREADLGQAAKALAAVDHALQQAARLRVAQCALGRLQRKRDEAAAERRVRALIGAEECFAHHVDGAPSTDPSI